MSKIAEAKRVIALEIEALKDTRDSLGNEFEEILEAVVSCKGKVIWCGMGKSGHIAGKLAATMASLGTPAFSLNPAEALHGDVGMVSRQDLVIFVSHSGESEEIIRLLPSIKRIGARTIAITSGIHSALAGMCELVQIMPSVQEACTLSLAPTSSTASVLAYGDALAVAASDIQGFSREHFAVLHPAGMLGRRLLLRVCDIMARGKEIPAVEIGTAITETIIEMSRKSLGVVAVTDRGGILKGLVTDGDLRRAIEQKADLYEGIVDSIMTTRPKSISADMLACAALEQLKENRINNFPVVDENHAVIGVITWQQIARAGVMI